MAVGRLIAGTLLAVCLASASSAHETPGVVGDIALDSEAAIARRQAAVGRRLGDHAFVDQDERPVRLADYLGRPLVVNLIYTGCAESCPLTVQKLRAAVKVARETLGPGSFAVASVSFDSLADSPARLRAYAREQGIGDADWRFLTGDHESVDALVEELGFLRVESPRGFDHIAQTSIVDPEGRVFAQVYGSDFEAPALVEPLKALAMNEVGARVDLDAIIERVRLFCTFYDPASGRYAFDYSFFISIAVSGLILLSLAAILLRSFIATNRSSGGTA
jgi:protein SCO1/2